MEGIGFNMVASGSAGNCSLVWDHDDLLIIDMGISRKRLRKRLEDLHVDPPQKSLFISHEHSDHCSGVKNLKTRPDFDIYTREMTGYAAGIGDFYRINGETVIGNFRVRAINISHDASDPVGYVIESSGIKISVISDLGTVSGEVMECIKGSDIMALESNHDEDMLKNGPYPISLKNRIAGRFGHLSNSQTADVLEKVIKPETRIILTHLSQKNNLPELAIEQSETRLKNRQIPYRSLECATQENGSSLYFLEI
ncbi:MAG: MBL fold metallo-hydrolase [Thermoplasmataceae archaeon]